MGEMADYLMEQAMLESLDNEMDEMPYRSCSYCKRCDLHWELHNSKWRLYEEDGRIHMCKKYSVKKER
jgi:hypothetical protein